MQLSSAQHPLIFIGAFGVDAEGNGVSDAERARFEALLDMDSDPSRSDFVEDANALA
jgi:hypothetical protein